MDSFPAIHLLHVAAITLLRVPLVTATFAMSRESFIGHTKENFILKDKVIRQQLATNMLSCAHLCLREPRCVSFNHEMSWQTKRSCELSDGTAGQFHDSVTKRIGWIYGEMARSLEKKERNDVQVIFTNLGAKGSHGPTDTSGYKGTPLEGKVKLENGIQTWMVPVTGIYSVEAWGASGANGTQDNGRAGWTVGGKGARIKGHFKLNAGEKLKILVGQEGESGSGFSAIPGSGGGGTFITTANKLPLVIAGGGGGGAALRLGEKSLDGDPGQATENGSHHGGYGGSGGKLCPLGANLEGAAGGGLFSDGESSATSTGGSSFYNGGMGGTSMPGVSNGGFGGGGAGTSAPGGGGGYSGGGVEAKEHKETVAGGGGSYNSGISQVNSSGVKQGDGKVVIKLIE